MSLNPSFAYRLAAIDLDDTLLSPDKSISRQNREAVHALQKNGVRILLASGRRHENMLKYFRALELDGPIVSCQGAFAKDETTGQVLHSQCMPADLAAEVVRTGVERGITMVYYHLNGTYVAAHDEWTDLYNRRTGTPLKLMPSLRDFDGTMPLKVLWVAAPEVISDQSVKMASRYAGVLETVITDPEYLEFMAFGVTKSIGVAAVAAHLGVGPREVLAFGDGNNDVTMLEWAGLGIAMDHARESAKSAADLVGPEGDPASSFARAVKLVPGM